jgi:predicted TPR repeat methyltransferase
MVETLRDLDRARELLARGDASSRAAAGEGLERLAASAASDPALLDEVSLLLLQAGRFEAAQQAAERWLAAEKTPAGLCRIGECLRELAQYDKALLYFQRAVHQDKECVSGLCGAGSCLIASGYVVEGLMAVGQALHEDEAFAEAHRVLAVGLLRQGALEQAEAAALEALRLAPEAADMQAAVGLVRMNQDRLEEAEHLLRRSVATRPFYAEGWANLGYLLRRMDRGEEAAGALRRSLEIKPFKAATWNTLANALWSMNRLQDAEEALRKACELEPQRPDHLTNLGGLLSEMRRYDEALDVLKQALRIDPGHLPARSNMPMLHVQAGRLEQALAEARELARRHPDFPNGRHNLAAICNKLDRLDEAEAEAKRAAELAPHVQKHHFVLAEVLKRQGRLDKALGAAQTALAVEDNAKARFRLGLILRERGEAAEAVKNFRRSLDLDPEDTEGASMFLAAMDEGQAPDAAPPAYIRRVFDSYAVRFEEHLVKGLRYEGPQRLVDLLAPRLGGRQNLSVLDLGCGTGLCGKALRPLAGWLTGVDLSESMIEQARRSGVYDELTTEDVVQALQSRSGVDVVAAGDLLIYFGDLSPVFTALAKALAPGGMFAGNVEAMEQGRWRVNSAGRYAHSESYVRESASQAGLAVLSLDPACLREEDKKPVPGYLMLLQAPEA